MNKLLSIEKLYYDGNFFEMESEETGKIKCDFYKVCLDPITKNNYTKGRKAEDLYGASIANCHKDGFIAGFRAAVSLLLDRAG